MIQTLNCKGFVIFMAELQNNSEFKNRKKKKLVIHSKNFNFASVFVLGKMKPV